MKGMIFIIKLSYREKKLINIFIVVMIVYLAIFTKNKINTKFYKILYSYDSLEIDYNEMYDNIKKESFYKNKLKSIKKEKYKIDEILYLDQETIIEILDYLAMENNVEILNLNFSTPYKENVFENEENILKIYENEFFYDISTVTVEIELMPSKGNYLNFIEGLDMYYGIFLSDAFICFENTNYNNVIKFNYYIFNDNYL